MASRKKKKKKKPQRAQQVSTAPEPAASANRSAESDAEAPKKRRSSTLATIIIVLVVGGASTAYLLTRGPALVEVKNAAGGTDRCPTCHRFEKRKHPAIAGHEDGKKLALAAIGCTPCHGGDGSAKLKRPAHEPPAASSARALLPRAFATSGCASCHIIGDRATTALVAGQKLFLETNCVGCHYPGRRTPGVGPDLRKATMPSAAKLQRLLLEPPADKTMWSLNDRTYRGRFSESKPLADLMRYVLSIAATPAPLRAHWAQPKVSAKLAPCDSCHAKQPGAAAKGAKHRCPELRAKSPLLACVRCHDAKQDARAGAKIARCPSVRAAAPQCATCHLRDE
ncbi:MAG: hypothetical protein KC503_38235 [Myxococcales bacterium]|nr:hypothetical protein [Myxococcales bacterium]